MSEYRFSGYIAIRANVLDSNSSVQNRIATALGNNGFTVTYIAVTATNNDSILTSGLTNYVISFGVEPSNSLVNTANVSNSVINTLRALAANVNITLTNIANGNTVTTATGGTYTVVAGDTLSKIATRFNTTVSAIAQANGITNVNRISIGQRLVIPNVGLTPVITGATPTPTGNVSVTTGNVPNSKINTPNTSNNFFKNFATGLGISSGVLAVAGVAVLLVIIKK